MACRKIREALRGEEVPIFDFMFEVLTAEQWAQWLAAPLEHAVTKGNRGLAQKLVEAGAEVGNALHEVVRGGHREFMNDLLESGASLAIKDKDGRTPLHIAAYQGATEMVQLLLAKGADRSRDVRDNEYKTPLHLAADKGHVATALALLTADVNADLRCGPLNPKAIITVVDLLNGEYVELDLLRAVIKRGADVEAVDEKDKDQCTALHSISWFENVEAIDMLVGAGANIEARTDDGWTPLHRACEFPQRENVLCLLKHGANANAQTKHLETPLLIAAREAEREGMAEVVDYLLRAGADEALVDEEGCKAVDLISTLRGPYGHHEEYVRRRERVRQLLANAPIDRAWRRRGYLVLCRAYPDRVQESQVINDTHHTGAAWRNRTCAMVAKAGGTAGDITTDDTPGWVVVVAKVLRMEEEGIFRTIVGYL